MPEGHTVHALADRLRRAFGGQPVHASSPQGRFPDAARLDGAVLADARAHGKHLFVDIGAEILHVHLGLIGSFPVRPLDGAPVPPPVGQVRLRLIGATHVADLRGPMVCARSTPEHRDTVLAGLGPDPLDPEAVEDRGWQRAGGSRRAIGELMLDQRVLAGVGNVYRCEVLHRQGLDPLLPGNRLGRQAWQSLWGDLVRLLPLGVVYGQILTVPDQVAEAQALLGTPRVVRHTAALTGEALGSFFERRFLTYQRAGHPCHRCGTHIRARKVAGRTLYWCPTCQGGAGRAVEARGIP